MKSGVTELRIGAAVSLALGLAAACEAEQPPALPETELAATLICGNAVVDPGEQCDDGNEQGGDGCDQCRIECDASSDCPNDWSCDITKGRCSSCARHCDCPQGQVCFQGGCLNIPDVPVYCCAKAGCPPGRRCFDAAGESGTCAENPEHHCDSACECGPAHCCKQNVCVKDIDDPWMPGGTEIGPSCVAGVDATYCCADPLCHAGREAYGASIADFRCHDSSSNQAEAYCGGKRCYYAGDCSPGESCVDRRSPRLPLGTSCSTDGGICVSNAVAEALYGHGPSEMFPACSKGCLLGQKCEAGWRPGGVYAVERVVGICGSCGNGSCEIEQLETAVNCAEDCACADGVCDASEIDACPADCALCGNGLCDPFESPKLCSADCPVTCGDGSCSSSEISTCSEDCACPSSATNTDLPVACGDGVCQRVGAIPESCDNCRRDCEQPSDSDGDGVKDGCDACPFDPANDPDGDGVCDGSDVCLGTSLPESVPTVALGFNRWALVDGDGNFDTKRAGRGAGSGTTFTTADTKGCSCEQIIAALGLGQGHTEYGCSTSVMLAWVAQLGP